MITLSNLPKLEKLDLRIYESVNGKMFKNFKMQSLKAFTCKIEQIKNGFSDLIKNCPNLEDLEFTDYDDDEVKDFINCWVQIFKKHSTITPLLIRTDQCNVRLSKKFSEDPAKLIFEIYEIRYYGEYFKEREFNLLYNTENEEHFKNLVTSAIKLYRKEKEIEFAKGMW